MSFSIQPIYSISSVPLNLLNPSLIAIDIDNTLLQSKKFYGSVEWQKMLTKRYTQCGCPYQKANKTAFLQWKKVQSQIEVCFVEENIATVLKEWKKNHIIVALTSRDSTLTDATMKQLKSLNIASLFSAVIFAGNLKKGSVLFDFVKNHNLKMEQIIALDDKYHHLKNIQKHCKDNKISYQGFHYLAKKPYPKA